MEELELSSKVVIESIDQSKKDADRDGDAEHRCKGADTGLVLDKRGCNMKPSTGRNDGGNDCHLRVTPNESAIAVRVEYRCRRQEVVDPPHAEGEPGAGNADQCRIHGPALFLNHSRECCNRPDDSLAQHNDGEETEAWRRCLWTHVC